MDVVATGAVATGAAAAGAGIVCGAAVAVAAGCSVACWLELVVARLRLREPPAYASVASSDIAVIRTSLRMEIPVIRSIHLTQFARAGD